MKHRDGSLPDSDLFEGFERESAANYWKKMED